MKQLQEIATDWFVRDEETYLTTQFDENEGSGRLMAFFNAFVPIGSNTAFEPLESTGWYKIVEGGGVSSPRFRGAMVFEDVLSLSVWRLGEYTSLVDNEQAVHAGIHNVNKENGNQVIALISEFYVIEVSCLKYEFFAIELFD